MDYISPFMMNPMCMDNDTVGWFYAREDFTRTGSSEAYERMLAFVTPHVPLMAWE